MERENSERTERTEGAKNDLFFFFSYANRVIANKTVAVETQAEIKALSL